MYKFTSEKALLASVDITLRDWVRDCVKRYDSFDDLVKHIDTVLPDVTDSTHVLDALRSFITSSHRSRYIRSVLGDALPYMVQTGNGVNMAVKAMYKAVFTNRFADDAYRYMQIWDLCRKA